VEHARMLRLIRPARIHLDARLEGPTVTVATLLELTQGDILAFDYPVGKPLDVTVNGKLKYRGELITSGRKRAFEVQQLVEA
jgi:flagellar motor switch protein FliM